MSKLDEIKKSLRKKSSKKQAKTSASFFKTGKGQYAEGDVFIGVQSKDLKLIAKENSDLSYKDLLKLLKSKIHEERVLVVLVLGEKYRNQDSKKAVDFYIKHRNKMNNWDIVDLSAYQILGDYLKDKKKNILYEFAKEENIWARRISIVATYAFIKNKDLKDVFKISKLLLGNKEDLMHKAVGWMLREAGKVDEKKLTDFLKQNYTNIPRTTLRYAIERFPEKRRKLALSGTF